MPTIRSKFSPPEACAILAAGKRRIVFRVSRACDSYLRDKQRVVTKMSENIAGQAFDIQLIVFQPQNPIVLNSARLNLMGN